MKLGELRGAIRKTKGNPHVNVAGLRLDVMKTPLLAELEARFPGGKAVETDIGFNEATGEMLLPVGNREVDWGPDVGREVLVTSDLDEETVAQFHRDGPGPVTSVISRRSLLDLDDEPAAPASSKPSGLLV